MIEVVWSVNIMVAILISGVGYVLYYIFTYDKNYSSWIRSMSEKDLNKFLNKIEQLNQIAKLIKNNPNKKKALSNCKTHEEVIKLASNWGFEIGKRWGEY